MSHRNQLIRTVIVIAGIAGLLAGCSGSGTEAPPVATLQSQAAPVSAAADRRPVFPFDATDEEKADMSRSWEKCMVENAGPKYQGSAEVLIVKGGLIPDDEKGKAALRTCLPLQPEAFDEHQLRVDRTAFKDNQREWYLCAKAAGYKLTPPDPDTGQFGLTEIGPNGDVSSPKFEECRRKAFMD